MSDKHCPYCSKKFGLFLKRKNCWSCMQVLCEKCIVSFTAPSLGWIQAQDVCPTCKESLGKKQEKAAAAEGEPAAQEKVEESGKKEKVPEIVAESVAVEQKEAKKEEVKKEEPKQEEKEEIIQKKEEPKENEVQEEAAGGDGQASAVKKRPGRKPSGPRRGTQSRSTAREQAKKAQAEREKEENEMEEALNAKNDEKEEDEKQEEQPVATGTVRDKKKFMEGMIPLGGGGGPRKGSAVAATSARPEEVVKHSGPQFGLNMSELANSRGTLRKVGSKKEEEEKEKEKKEEEESKMKEEEERKKKEEEEEKKKEKEKEEEEVRKKEEEERKKKEEEEQKKKEEEQKKEELAEVVVSKEVVETPIVVEEGEEDDEEEEEEEEEENVDAVQSGGAANEPKVDAGAEVKEEPEVTEIMFELGDESNGEAEGASSLGVPALKMEMEAPVVGGESSVVLSPRSTLLVHACPVCSIGFSSKEMLLQHLKSQHKSTEQERKAILASTEERLKQAQRERVAKKSPRAIFSKSPRAVGGKSPRSTQFLPHSCPVCRKGFLEKEELLSHLEGICGGNIVVSRKKEVSIAVLTEPEADDQVSVVFVGIDGEPVEECFELDSTMTAKVLARDFLSFLTSVRKDMSEVQSCWLIDDNGARVSDESILLETPLRKYFFAVESSGRLDAYDMRLPVVERQLDQQPNLKASLLDTIADLDRAEARRSGVVPKVTELDNLIDEARAMKEPAADPVAEWLAPAPKKTMLEAASPYMSEGESEDPEEPEKQPPSGMAMLHKQVKGVVEEEGSTLSRGSMVTIEVSDESSEFCSSTEEE